MSYNQPISNMNPHTQPPVGDTYNPVQGQQSGFSQQQPGFNQQQPGFNQQQPGFNQQQPGFNQQQPGYNQSGYGQSGMAPGQVGANPSGYDTAGVPGATGGTPAGYSAGAGSMPGYAAGHAAGYGAGASPAVGPGSGHVPPTTGMAGKPRNPSVDISLGRLEQAAGTLLSSQRMKDRGLQKEEAARAARADAHAQALQGHHLQRAERMEAAAGAHRNRAVGAGAHPDYGQLGGPMGGTGVGGARQGL